MIKYAHSGLAVLALIISMALGLAVSVVFAQTSGRQPVVQRATWVASVAQAPITAAPGAAGNGAEILASRTSTPTTTIFLPQVPRGFTYPQFTVTKSASEPRVGENEIVVYTVAFTNTGDLPGVLETIQDTLPAGFTFQHMEGSSDVSAPPNGTSGTIIWNGPFPVAAHSELKLVYAVEAASTLGTYTNTATATTLVGSPPQEPGTATVGVGPSFIDDFEGGIDNWTPFTNYWRNREEQWFWDLGKGVNGSNAYTNYGNAGAPAPEKGAHDSLAMVLIEGAQEWTDYRYRVKFNLLSGPLAGVWFRGKYQYEEGVTVAGQWVTGYYFTLKVRDEGRTDTGTLWQLRTDEEHGDETWPPYWYHFSNPFELERVHLETANVEPGEWHEITIEVQGARIKCYVDEELVIDFIDDEGSIFLEGTVGLVTYGNWPNFSVVKFDDVVVDPLD